MLDEVIREAAVRFDTLPALVTADGWSFSYRELDQASDEVAVWLQRHHGVAAETVAAIMMPTSVDYLVYYAAFAKLGAITAGVNPHLTARERKAVLEACEPAIVVSEPDLLEGIPDGCVVLDHVAAPTADDVCADRRVRGKKPTVLPSDPDRPVTICFTSGSTGEPKGALFRDRQLRAIFQMDTGGAWGGGSPTILGTQFAHIGAMTKVPWLLAGGATLHVMRKWRAADVLRLTAEHRMAAINAGPTQIALLLRQPDFEAYDLSCVRVIVAGTGPSSPAIIDEARRRFDCAYSVRYSSTECGGVGLATAMDAPDSEALYTIGRPRPGVDAKIADDQGNELATGETGELWLRSAAVMSEYWRNDEATRETLVGGWLRSGDLGYRDDTGCYRLVGRAKEMYIRGGYNVFPLEVERVLGDHPKVAQVAIVPRADPVMGEIGEACIVPRSPGDPPTLEEIRAFGEQGLARFKLPERLRLLDALPLNASDKLDRRALAESGLDASPNRTDGR
jgi:acyl-CoA synthetase (AMP-forming)/AMP-acid ligase II